MYKGNSVLLTGDFVGRLATDACIASEKAMVVGSDVLIAPHHWADNADFTAS